MFTHLSVLICFFLGKQVVVYQDSFFAIVYDCLQVVEDDHCAAGRSYVQVLARKPQINIAEEALYNALLVQYAPALHLDVTEVERVPQIRKKLPPPQFEKEWYI